MKQPAESLTACSSAACASSSWMDATGMQHILEDTQVRGTVLKFAHLSSDLLAYGGLDGIVRIAQLGYSCKICHVSIWLTAELAHIANESLQSMKGGFSTSRIAHSAQCRHQKKNLGCCCHVCMTQLFMQAAWMFKQPNVAGHSCSNLSVLPARKLQAHREDMAQRSILA